MEEDYTVPTVAQEQQIPSYGYQPPMPASVITPPLDQPWYGIGFFNAVKRFFQKYSTFSGRASRSEYWWSYLGIRLIYFLLIILAAFVAETVSEALAVAIVLLFLVVTFIPSLAITVRRLHDSNLSGWFFFLPIGIYLAGFLILIGAVAIAYTADATDEIPIIGIGALIIWYLMMLASNIVHIVLMVRSSKPEGVRFDMDSSVTILPPHAQYAYAQTGYAPALGQQMYGQQPYYEQQGYTQPDYGQPSLEQQQYGQLPTGQLPTEQLPPEAQPPYSPMQ